MADTTEAPEAQHVADRNAKVTRKVTINLGNTELTFAKGGTVNINLASLPTDKVEHLLVRGAQIVLRNAIIPQRKAATEPVAGTVAIPNGSPTDEVRAELDRVWQAWIDGTLGKTDSTRSGLTTVEREVFLALLAANGTEVSGLKATEIKAYWAGVTETAREYVRTEAAAETARRAKATAARKAAMASVKLTDDDDDDEPAESEEPGE